MATRHVTTKKTLLVNLIYFAWTRTLGPFFIRWNSRLFVQVYPTLAFIIRNKQANTEQPWGTLWIENYGLWYWIHFCPRGTLTFSKIPTIYLNKFRQTSPIIIGEFTHPVCYKYEWISANVFCDKFLIGFVCVLLGFCDWPFEVLQKPFEGLLLLLVLPKSAHRVFFLDYLLCIF